VVGDEGTNTVYLVNDGGSPDQIYCGTGPNDTLVLVGGRDPGDFVASTCEHVVTQ
jgi:hypothetical protein